MNGSFANRVELLAEAFGMPIAELLRKTQYSYEAWSALRKSGISPPAEVVLTFATALEVSPEYLDGGLPLRAIGNLSRLLEYLRIERRDPPDQAKRLFAQLAPIVIAQDYRDERDHVRAKPMGGSEFRSLILQLEDGTDGFDFDLPD